MTIRPAPPDSGILFRRTDLPPSAQVLAHADNVGDTMLCTTLCRDRVRIFTVDHPLSDADTWETVVFGSYTDAPISCMEAPALPAGGAG